MSDRVDDRLCQVKFSKILKKKGNEKCADCDKLQPQWASPTFGIFLCINCAGIHRSLGVHISFVRSVTMDRWKDSDLIKMEIGGNSRSNSFLKKRGVDTYSQAKYKYDNVIAKEYSRKLTCLVDDVDYKEQKFPNFNWKVFIKEYDLKKSLSPKQTITLEGFGSSPTTTNNKNTFNNNNNNILSNHKSPNQDRFEEPVATMSKGLGIMSSAVFGIRKPSNNIKDFSTPSSSPPSNNTNNIFSRKRSNNTSTKKKSSKNKDQSPPLSLSNINNSNSNTKLKKINNNNSSSSSSLNQYTSTNSKTPSPSKHRHHSLSVRNQSTSSKPRRVLSTSSPHLSKLPSSTNNTVIASPRNSTASPSSSQQKKQNTFKTFHSLQRNSNLHSRSTKEKK